MKFRFSIVLLLLILFGLWDREAASAAPATPPLQKTQESAPKGYSSITSHDEIVSKAKAEASLNVLARMEPATIKAMAAAFTKKYPFIKLRLEEITGTDSAQRSILEIKSGAAKEWDVANLSTDFYNQYLPFLWKVDLLRMAQQGVLQIPIPMIDSKNRNIVGFFSFFHVTAYNRNLLSESQLPRGWHDILKPDFRGKKFANDIRPLGIAGLVPAWGLERTLEYARSMAAQQPIWVRGGTRTLGAIMRGEIPMIVGSLFHATKRSQARDRRSLLQYVLLEPVPVRLALQLGILSTAEHPHAALLWLEWLASVEAQEIADAYEPLCSSVYVRGGAVEQALRGKELSVVSWEHHQSIDAWAGKIVEAFGFPKAER
ncbi:MAG: ABC transporter substrate-binding protein [Candidatus Binatia bacterium]